ncbi:hypothetical protein ACOSP7_007738 [Xanthoceras sorbifolium]
MARGGGQHNTNTNRFGPITPPHDHDTHPRVQSTMDDTNSPYFLRNGDNPGLVVVSHLLSGSNYNTWRRSMLIALNAKNKLGFRLLGLSQGSLDINTYFTRLKILWDELKLNESYSVIRAQILMLDPLPNEEQQRTLGSNPSSGFSSSESMAFSTVSSTSSIAAFSSQSTKKKNRPICSHCGIMGHIIDRCYNLHGYRPSSLQSISKSTLSSSSGVSSPFAMIATASSSSPSHLTADQCQQLIAYLSTQLHQSSLAPPEASSTMGPSISSCSGNLFSFPFSNHRYLNSRTWVIDSGATHHVCCNSTLFSSFTEIPTTQVTLPDGRTVHITRIGLVRLTDMLVLHDVLYIPLFHFNLLSTSSLTLSHHCSVNILPYSCLIQNLTRGLTIGKGRREGNLYLLDLGTTSCNSIISSCNSVVMHKSDVWHFRLGHPSFVKLQILHNELQIPVSTRLPSHCAICHFAKQKRLPFISHNNMSTKPFDLIHLNIWGPFHVSTTKGHKFFLTIVDDCTRTI